MFHLGQRPVRRCLRGLHASSTSPLTTISLARFESGDGEEAQRLAEACQTDGFFYLADHGISQSVLDDTLRAASTFFDLPAAKKFATHWSKTEVYPGTLGVPVRGHVGFEEERLGPYPGDAAEQKEAFDWAMDKPALGVQTPWHGPNLWPNQPSDRLVVEKPLVSFRDEALEVARRLMRLMCVARGLPMDAYDSKYTDPTIVCRTLRYPASLHEDACGCNAHTDQGFFTLLHQDSVGGLQVKLRAEEWVEVKPVSGKLVINIGDALSADTGGVWRSTLHRVTTQPGNCRHSVALFYDPDADVPMLPSQVDTDNPKAFEAIKVLLHKVGLKPDAAGLDALREMDFAEYKRRVFMKYLPDTVPYEDFTDVKAYGERASL